MKCAIYMCESILVQNTSANNIIMQNVVKRIKTNTDLVYMDYLICIYLIYIYIITSLF